MRLISLVSTALFLGLAVVFGLRLLGLARRSHGAPEIWLGSFFFVGAGLGYALGLFVYYFVAFPPGVSAWLGPFCTTCVNLGTIAFLIFNWRVFRRDDTWAALACGVGIMLVVGSALAQALTSGFQQGHAIGAPYLLAVALRGGGFFWGAVESLIYYRKARSQAALGLIEPTGAVRFLLWGAACVLLGLPFLVHLIVIAAAPAQTYSDGSTLTITAMAALATLIVWVAFFPPRFYRRMLGSEV